MKNFILLLFLSTSINNLCIAQPHYFKFGIGLGVKKNFLYDYDKNTLKSNLFYVTTKINPFPMLVVDYKINRELDIEFTASVYRNAYYVGQSITKDGNQVDYEYGIKTITGNFCLGVKYNIKHHSFICGINLDYNSFNSFSESGMGYAGGSNFEYKTNLHNPFISYFSTGLFLAYKIELSKKSSIVIKYSQDFSRLAASDINTQFTANNVTDSYYGHVSPNYGYLGIILIHYFK